MNGAGACSHGLTMQFEALENRNCDIAQYDADTVMSRKMKRFDLFYGCRSKNSSPYYGLL